MSLLIANLVDNDASGASVVAKQAVLLAHGFDARIFAQKNRSSYADVTVVADPDAALPADSFFMSSDFIFLEYGWETELLDALQLAPARAKKLIYFHGVTPRQFLPEELGAGVDRSYASLTGANVDIVFHATDYSKRLAIGAGVTRPRFVKLQLPIDLPRLKPAARKEGPVRLLSVGRMATSKGQTDIVKALRKLRDRGFDAWTLKFVFNDKTVMQPYLTELKALIADSGLSQQVTLAGPVADRRQMAQTYAAADLTILASRHETYCFPLLESLACGTPVVAYGAGAVPEVAAGRANIVPPGDIDALAETIDRVLRAKPLFIGDRVPPLPRADFLAGSEAVSTAQSHQEFRRTLLRTMNELTPWRYLAERIAARVKRAVMRGAP